METTSLSAIFLTGLLTGGLSCMAVQGGLLTATIAQREQDKLKEGLKNAGHALPIISFLVAKLIAYTAFGFFLGWLGSLFQFSLGGQIALQVFVAIFMIGTALSILDVHPFFRYFVIQPPKFLTRFIRKKSKSKDIFAPAVLGGFTIFLPCGVTQAMMTLAIASGNPFLGASILFAFVLGTSPVFFILGYFTARIGSLHQARFMRLVALFIIGFAIYNLNNVLALSGSNLTIENGLKKINCSISFCEKASASNLGESLSDIAITIDEYGYTPNRFTVAKGSEVTLRLTASGRGSCAQAFTIPSLGIQKLVQTGTTEIVKFTTPNEPTEISFMCSMGMYRGTIKVM